MRTVKQHDGKLLFPLAYAGEEESSYISEEEAAAFRPG